MYTGGKTCRSSSSGLASTEQLANAMDTLDADFEPLLPATIGEIREMLPEDSTFESSSAKVLSFLDADGSLRDEAQRRELGNALDALRAHIGETYRLHRRTIRHRRARVIEDVNDDLLPFDVTGRRPPVVLPRHAPAAVDALLEWQQQIVSWVADHVDESSADAEFAAFGDVLAVLASRIDELSDDFRQAALFRVTGDSEAAERAGLSAVEREVLQASAVLPFEAEILTATNESSDDGSLVAQLIEVIRKHRRTVAFCGAGELPNLVAAALRDGSQIPVYEHTSATPPAQIETDLQKWRKFGGVVIADATAEDGVNLQQADAAVHLRLPWSPNRLEQRIGRIDRYAGAFGATTEPAEHFVVAIGDTDHSFPAAWTDLLVSAFEAWTASMSALQDRLDELQVELWAMAVREGPQRMRDAREDVRTALTDERKQIQVMDALDAVQDTSLGERVAIQLGQSETHWPFYEKALRRYVSPASGGIRFTVTEPGPITEFGVDTNRPPLVSPLMLTRFGKLPPESLHGVFNRMAALRQPGVRLFRLGNPFISGLAKVIDVDERGQASAMLRRARTSDPLPYFGFDLLIEADLTSAVERLEGEGERALRRYADALLPPTLARVWLKADETKFIRDGKLLDSLNREYDERDVNLGSRTDILVDVFGGFDRFAQQARAAEKTAVETFANEEWLRNRADRAHTDAHRILTIRRAQAEARQAAGRLVTDTESYLLDVDMHEAVVNALQQPTIRVVSASCVIGGQWTNDR